MTALVELDSGDDPAAWVALGFAVEEGDVVRVGSVAVRCSGEGGGLRGWTLASGGEPGEPSLDGIATAWTAPSEPAEAVEHPNGALALDHVVVFTGDRDRTVAALSGAGGDVRRLAGPPSVPVSMAFVRFGEAIVEVAEGGDPPRLWGLVAVVSDLDACARRLGPLLGPPKDAVQPGRRIATVRPQAGLETALAFMSPRVG